MEAPVNKRNDTPHFFRFSATTALLLLFAAFVALRLVSAWIMRNEINGDLAIVHMMVRDIVSGAPLPAFFSGQAYMGSLEPVLNAITHFCFGRTVVATAMGTTLFILLSAIAVVRMAKRTGGPWAAGAALLFCVIGPMPFVHYAISPRGGYGVLIFVTAALLDLGSLLISDERYKDDCRLAVVLPLGLLAGIGFWCNQLIFPAVAAIAAGVLFFAPGVLRRAKFWFGAPVAFIVGSAPFWVWNLRNGWESFKMAGSLVPDPLIATRNLLLLFSRRLPSFLGVEAQYAGRLTRIAVIAAVLLLVILSLAVFLRPRLRRDGKTTFPEYPGEAKVQMALVCLYIAFFTLCFVFSGFAVFETPRYLLPLVPVLALCAGVTCTLPFKRLRLAAAAALVLCVAWQARELHQLAVRAKYDAEKTAGFDEAVTYLESLETEAVYCPFKFNSLNLLGNGKTAFTDFMLERRPDFRRRAERAVSPAIAADYMGYASWVRATGGTACFTNVGGVRLATQISPPANDEREIPSAAWLSLTDASGTDLADKMSDRSRAVPLLLPPAGETLTLTFKKPETVSCVRLFLEGAAPGTSYEVLGKSPDTADYRRLGEILHETQCVWSGPRFYPDGNSPLREIRFPARELAAVQIRILGGKHPAGNMTRTGAALFEVQVLAPGAEGSVLSPETASAAANALVDLLHRQGIYRLYADRWVANFVAEQTSRAIWTTCGDNLYPKPTGLPAPSAPPAEMDLDARTAVLVSSAGTPAARDVFAARKLKMREIATDKLGTLFVPESIQPVPFGSGVPTGILFSPDYPFLVPSYAWMTSALASVPPDRAKETVAELYSRDPESLPLLRTICAMKELEPVHNLAYYRFSLLTGPEEAVDAPAMTANIGDHRIWHGTRLLDRRTSYAPGSAVTMRHYWIADSTNSVGNFRVFVHFTGPGGFRFQDDYSAEIPSFGIDDIDDYGCVYYHVDRRIEIPADAPTGTYELGTGIFNVEFPSHRLHAETRLPTKRNAALVREFFEVERSR